MTDIVGRGDYEVGVNTAQIDSGLASAEAKIRASGDRASAATSKSFLDGAKVAAGAVGVMGVAITAVGIDAAIKWESALTGVAKTVNPTKEELDALGATLRGMASELGISAVELAGLAEQAGALGIKTPDIAEFTRTAALLGETTDVSAGAAALALGKINAVIPLTSEEMGRFASTLVQLGNNGASSEAQIIDMAQGMAGAAATVKMSVPDMLAWASAAASVGVESEAGASSFQRFALGINEFVATSSPKLATIAEATGMTREEFEKLWSEDSSAALQRIVQGLAEMDGNTRQATLSALGFTDIRLQKYLLLLAANQDTLNNSLLDGEKGWGENAAMQEEWARRAETTEQQMKMLQQDLNDIAITIGEALLPHVKNFVALVRDVTQGIGNWMRENKGLVDTLVPIASVLAGILALKWGGNFLGMLLAQFGLGGLGSGLARAIIPSATKAGLAAGGAQATAHTTAATGQGFITRMVAGLIASATPLSLAGTKVGTLVGGAMVAGIAAAVVGGILLVNEGLNKMADEAERATGMLRGMSAEAKQAAADTEVAGQKLGDVANFMANVAGLVVPWHEVSRSTKELATELNGASVSAEGFAQKMGTLPNAVSGSMTQSIGEIRTAIEQHFPSMGNVMTTLFGEMGDESIERFNIEITEGLTELQRNLAGGPMQGVFETLGAGFDLTIEQANAFGVMMAATGEDIQTVFADLEASSATRIANFRALLATMPPSFDRVGEEARALAQTLGLTAADMIEVFGQAGSDAAGSLVDGLRSGIPSVRDQWKAFVNETKNALDPMKQIAWLEARLSGDKLAEGLNSKNPFVRDSAEQMRDVMMAQVDDLKNLMGIEGERAGEELGESAEEGIDSKRQDVQTASDNLEPRTGIWKTWGVDAGHFFGGGANDGIGDKDQSVQTAADNLKPSTNKWGDWGWNAGEAWGIGVGRGVASQKDDLQSTVRRFSGPLEGFSPPKEGPLHFIDRWGLNVGRTYTEKLAEGIESGRGLLGRMLARLAGQMDLGQFGGIFDQFGGRNFIPALAGAPPFAGMMPQSANETHVHLHIGQFIGNDAYLYQLRRDLERVGVHWNRRSN